MSCECFWRAREVFNLTHLCHASHRSVLRDVRSVSGSQNSREAAFLDDGPVASLGPVCCFSLRSCFSLRMRIPQLGEPLQTVVGRTLCFCFLSLNAQALSLLKLHWPRDGVQSMHIPGEKAEPSADAAPQRGLFTHCPPFLSLQINRIPHHHHQTGNNSFRQSFRHPCLHYFCSF